MKKILIVDDALFMRSMIRNILIRNNYSVVAEAENGIDAIEKYKQYRPDIVIMDLTMDKMDGLDAMNGIKQFDSKAKMIVCSAMGQNYMVLDAVKLGAIDFVVKPFTEERLLEALKKADLF